LGQPRGGALTNARLFTAVGTAALLAGALLWHLGRPARQAPDAQANAPPVVAIAPAALFAATFTDPDGATRALGQFEGKILVLNFWATWCEPCRAEMPAFNRLHQRWSGRGVQFLGLSDEPREKAEQFGRVMGIGYPLWTGRDQVSDLSRRLGNQLGGLPHTVVVDRVGRVVTQRVGPYTEAELEEVLAQTGAKSS
jgi:thiol-disulfide isomerase/thioredoxin